MRIFAVFLLIGVSVFGQTGTFSTQPSGRITVTGQVSSGGVFPVQVMPLPPPGMPVQFPGMMPAQRELQSCKLHGTVVNSVTHAPIERARVNVAGTDGQVTAQSDASGAWVIDPVRCAPGSLNASRVGFLTWRISAKSVAALGSSPDTPVEIEMQPQAVISGRVLDDHGDPVFGGRVTLYTSRIVNGLRTFAPGRSEQINDLGDYRLPTIEPGKYIVCAGGLAFYRENCYPGPVSEGAATALPIAAGADARVNFTLTSSKPVTVRGNVVGYQPGTGNLNFMVRMGATAVGVNSTVGNDGSFMLTNIPSGSGTLVVNMMRSGARLMGTVPLNVNDRDVEEVHVYLEPGVAFSGKVTVVSTTGQKPPGGFNLRLSSESAGYVATWDQDKTSFTFADVIPGSYDLMANAPPPFYIKSIVMNGRVSNGSALQVDAGGGSLEIVLSDDGGSIEGDVSLDNAPASVSWVLASRDNFSPRNIPVPPNGHFKISNLPPGDYQVFAFDDFAKVEYANPEWMRKNAKGIVVKVGAGQTSNVQLTEQIAPAD